MTTTYGGYKTLILEAGVPEGDLDATEEIMRVETGGTLDHLTKSEFLALARLAHQVVAVLRAEG
jgi:hypothetical protein